MAPPTLAIVAAVNALTAAVFVAAGMRVLDRRAKDRLPLQAMASWWLAMGVFVALQALLAFAAVVGIVEIDAFTAGRFANGPLLALGVWGFCFHVIYLYTGRRGHAVPLAIYAVALAVAYDASVVLHPLSSVTPVAWEVTPAYDPPFTGEWLWPAVLAGVGLPLIAACIAYAAAIPRLERRDQKRRALLVSTGVFVWVAAGLVAQFFAGAMARFYTITVLGLLAAVLVYLAYFAPAAMQRGDAPTVDETGAPIELGLDPNRRQP